MLQYLLMFLLVKKAMLQLYQLFTTAHSQQSFRVTTTVIMQLVESRPHNSQISHNNCHARPGVIAMQCIVWTHLFLCVKDLQILVWISLSISRYKDDKKLTSWLVDKELTTSSQEIDKKLTRSWQEVDLPAQVVSLCAHRHVGLHHPQPLVQVQVL